jgi:hypothetical protein
MTEDEAYAHVAAEVSRRDLRSGLWTKALAESLGNENLAKSLYLKFRAQQLINDHRRAEKLRTMQEFQATVAAAKHRTVHALRRGFFVAATILCGLITLLCASVVFAAFADSQDRLGVDSGVACLVLALVFGFATVAFARGIADA